MSTPIMSTMSNPTPSPKMSTSHYINYQKSPLYYKRRSLLHYNSIYNNSKSNNIQYPLGTYVNAWNTSTISLALFFTLAIIFSALFLAEFGA